MTTPERSWRDALHDALGDDLGYKVEDLVGQHPPYQLDEPLMLDAGEWARATEWLRATPDGTLRPAWPSDPY